jgi:hypothetical protein
MGMNFLTTIYQHTGLVFSTLLVQMLPLLVQMPPPLHVTVELPFLVKRLDSTVLLPRGLGYLDVKFIYFERFANLA